MSIITPSQKISADPAYDFSDLMKTRKILLVDDEKAVRSSLSLFLTKNGFLVD